MKNLNKTFKNILKRGIYLPLIASIGYILYTYSTVHYEHGHYYLQDIEHIAGIVSVAISAYITWRKQTQSKWRSSLIRHSDSEN